MAILINIPNMEQIEDYTDIQDFEHYVQLDQDIPDDISGEMYQQKYHNCNAEYLLKRSTLRKEFLYTFVQNPESGKMVSWLYNKSEELKRKILKDYQPEQPLSAEEQKMLLKPKLTEQDVDFYAGFNSMITSYYWDTIKEIYLTVFGDKSCYLFYYCNIADTMRMENAYFITKANTFTQEETELSRKLYDTFVSLDDNAILYFDTMFSTTYSININAGEKEESVKKNLSCAMQTLVKQGGRMFGVLYKDKQKYLFGISISDGKCKIIDKDNIKTDWEKLDCFHNTYIDGLYELNI